MRLLDQISFDEANENTQELFKSIKSKVGMLPNLYAAMGVSDKLLGGFLAFTETLKAGEFTSKEQEAIALAAAQANGCAYCLSAHTALGKMHGFNEEETLAIRTQTIGNEKLKALATLTIEFIEKRGHPSGEAVQNFLEAGYSKAAFAELIGQVAINTITNYMFHNGSYKIDFPLAKQIDELQTT